MIYFEGIIIEDVSHEFKQHYIIYEGFEVRPQTSHLFNFQCSRLFSQYFKSEFLIIKILEKN